jgi:hypothetical protein
MEFVIIIIVWLILCGMASAMAEGRERSGFGWFVFAFFLSPILAWIALACLGKHPDARRRDAKQQMVLVYAMRHQTAATLATNTGRDVREIYNELNRQDEQEAVQGMSPGAQFALFILVILGALFSLGLIAQLFH